MAGRIPDINVIQDTPTSPNHFPRPIYISPDLPRIPGDGLTAPEVDLCTEGLQIDPNGKYPQPSTREIDTTSKYWIPCNSSLSTAKELARDDAGLIPYEHGPEKREIIICGIKRRTFIVLCIITIILICAAIGGGVGGYYASRPTPPMEDEGYTSQPVTSGTTGMASLPCRPAKVNDPSAPQATPRDTSNPYISPANQTPTAFDITCRRGVPNTGDADGVKISNVGKFVTYNFSTCMDYCAGLEECAGVVYSANLTEAVADGAPGANCLLKNATWEMLEKRETWVASALKQ